MTWDTSLIIFMEALLKDLIGFHFSAKWLRKSNVFFFSLAGDGSGVKLNFSLVVKWVLLVWVLRAWTH